MPKTLSTGTIIGLLKEKKFTEATNLIEDFFKSNESDFTSAMKVNRTLAAFAYENVFEEQTVNNILATGKLVVDIILKNQPAEELTDKCLQEIFYNSAHVLSRIIKQKLTEAITNYCEIPLKIALRLKDNSQQIVKAYTIYGELWNYFIAYSQKMKVSDEESHLEYLNISCSSIRYLMFIRKSNHFNVEKLVDRVTNVYRVFCIKGVTENMRQKVIAFIEEVSDCPAIVSEIEKVRLAILLFESEMTHSPKTMSRVMDKISSIVGTKSTATQFLFLMSSMLSNKVIEESQFDLRGNTSSKVCSLLVPICYSVLSSTSSSSVTSSNIGKEVFVLTI